MDVNTIYSDLSRADGDELMYVVNYTDNDGFVIVSAQKSADPVLAVVEEGNFNSPETKSNENFQNALSMIKEYTVSIRPVFPDSTLQFEKSFETDTLPYCETVGPRVKMKWNQAFPENIYCPNRIAGCGPVAVAQMLSYFKTPKVLPITYSPRKEDYLTLDWDNIVKHVQSINTYVFDADFVAAHCKECHLDYTYHDQLAKLVRQVGEKIATYTYGDSATTWTNMLSAEIYLRNDIMKDYNFQYGMGSDELFNRLQKDGIALMFSLHHTWITDGTMALGTRIYSYRNVKDDSGRFSYKEVISDDKYVKARYIHHNWGWGGNCNGYFLEDIFNSRKGYRYDSPARVKGDPSQDNVYDETCVEYFMFTK